MRAKVKAWVLFGGGTKFGEGRAELLRLVEEEGSLRRAVARLGMSYRGAWGYLKELEEAAGFPFVEPAGVGPSAGTRLTAQARDFLGRFETFRAAADEAAGRAFADAFGRRSVARRPGVRPARRPAPSSRRPS